MKRPNLSLGILMLSFAVSASAQTPVFKFPGNHRYSKAKIYFKNNNRIEASNLTIKDDHLTFVNKATSQNGEYNLSEVYLIKVGEGNKAGEYALIGGAISGLSAALSLASINSDPFTEGPSAGPWIAGWTAGGLLIGAIVGANQEKWKTLYVSEQN